VKLSPLEGTVRADWVDFNGHMSAPCFATLFGDANDATLLQLGFDAAWRARGQGLFVVEATYRYRREMRAGERFRVTTHLVRAASKRLWLTHRMTRDETIVCESDILFLHVSTSGPKAAPFSAADQARLAAMIHPAAPGA
jgi:acyl-CoA thioester hydrolase